MAPSFTFTRGYTGHEHLDMFALTNMNGRVYDPVIGRFLSPDPYVQLPDFSQNYNRYSYVLNNPLMYSDPSGEFIGFVIAGAAIGSYIGGALAAGDGGLKKANWNPFGGKQGSWKGTDWWQGAIVGGIVGAGIGALTATAVLPTSAFKVAGGGLKMSWAMTSHALSTANLNMASTLLTGGGLNDAWRSGVSGLISGAISGGVDLHLGKKYHDLGFWQGFAIHGGVGGVTNAVDGALTGKSGKDYYMHIAKGLAISGTMGGLQEGISAWKDGRQFINGQRESFNYGNGCRLFKHKEVKMFSLDKTYDGTRSLSIGRFHLPFWFSYDFTGNNRKFWNRMYTDQFGNKTFDYVWYNFPIIIPFIPYISPK